MPDETAEALKEIASLLRRRVEQTDEMAKRSEERMSKYQDHRPEPVNLDRIREDGEQRRNEIVAKMEQKTEQTRQEREKLQEEQRLFQGRLLTELERHNTLLEQLLSRLA